MMRLIKLELIQCKNQYMTLMFIVMGGFFLMGFAGYHLESVRGMNAMEMVSTIYGVTAFVFMMGVTLLCFVVLVRVFSTFASSMFNRNGYLYNTLPVTSYELVASKIIAAFIWLVIFGLVLLASMVVMTIGILLAVLLDNMDIFRQLITQVDLRYVLNRCIYFFMALFDGNGYYLFQSVMMILSTISIGYTIITLVHLPLIQQMKKALRYVVYLIVIVLMILAIEYIELPFLYTWMVLTILGILGYGLTSYLVAHKIDVAG